MEYPIDPDRLSEEALSREGNRLCDEELLAYLDGRLPPERRQEIARQAVRDPELADELALIADLTRAAGEAHRTVLVMRQGGQGMRDIPGEPNR